MIFVDSLCVAINSRNSRLCAGFDPVIEEFPQFIIDNACSQSSSNEDCIYQVLTHFYFEALKTLASQIALTKLNCAFFEQYGIGGMRALKSILDYARDLDVLTIADGKRSDIASSADAYARAFLGTTSFKKSSFRAFGADCLTVNPFLGLDTVQSFISACKDNGKGIFVLVKTSNAEATYIQGACTEGQISVSTRLAMDLHKKATELMGASGYSSIGAVVGATWPEEARALRQSMPSSYFLVPGFGAQGATALDSVAGKDKKNGGLVINASRALFGNLNCAISSIAGLNQELKKRATRLNNDINSALAS